jgi:hypothetical protein
MKDYVKYVILFYFFLIFFFLVLTWITVNAQLSYYYPGIYYLSIPYSFSPVYNSAFPLYPFTPISPFYNPGYLIPPTSIPGTFTAPALSPSPSATVSAVFPLVPFTPVTTISGVILADFLINTGNPEVDAVLNLIIQDPVLLENPFFLDALINTGNPDVDAALAWLIAVI